MAFFRITATQHLTLTALALAQDLDYTDAMCVFFAPPPRPCYIYLFPPDCDCMPVFVGTFGGRARQLSSSLAS